MDIFRYNYEIQNPPPKDTSVIKFTRPFCILLTILEYFGPGCRSFCVEMSILLVRFCAVFHLMKNSTRTCSSKHLKQQKTAFIGLISCCFAHYAEWVLLSLQTGKACGRGWDLPGSLTSSRKHTRACSGSSVSPHGWCCFQSFQRLAFYKCIFIEIIYIWYNPVVLRVQF